MDNKPGGGGTTGADFVAKAPADGYTLLYTTPGPQITNPFLMAKLPYDPSADLTPVTQVALVPSVLVVNKNLPVKSVKELIDYARANPGKLNFASAGIGSSSHLAGELFKHRARIDMVHVPYRGTGPALQDLLAGNVSLAIDSLAVYRPHIEAGSLRALAVSTLDRSPLLPDVPPIADELPGFEGSPVNYITVRSGTPPAIVARLNREINAVLDSREVKAYMLGSGIFPRGGTPAQMEALVRRKRPSGSRSSRSPAHASNRRHRRMSSSQDTSDVEAFRASARSLLAGITSTARLRACATAAAVRARHLAHAGGGRLACGAGPGVARRPRVDAAVRRGDRRGNRPRAAARAARRRACSRSPCCARCRPERCVTTCVARALAGELVVGVAWQESAGEIEVGRPSTTRTTATASGAPDDRR